MILKQMLFSKIHGATITERDLHYKGSIGIDKALLKKSGIAEGEKVQVLNVNNGARFETYAIEEKENSGVIALYGPAARCGEAGDKVIIISYVLATMDEIGNIKPAVVIVNERNEIVK
jgi:aspartate 1-decarboxylase